MSTQTMPIVRAKPEVANTFNTAFVVAWLFCLLFYFMEYAVRSAPSVMLPELRTAFGLSTVGLSSLIGLYYYSYAGFAIIAGASVDRWGGRRGVDADCLRHRRQHLCRRDCCRCGPHALYQGNRVRCSGGALMRADEMAKPGSATAGKRMM
jgi:hypothetical protein